MLHAEAAELAGPCVRACGLGSGFGSLSQMQGKATGGFMEELESDQKDQIGKVGVAAG